MESIIKSMIFTVLVLFGFQPSHAMMRRVMPSAIVSGIAAQSFATTPVARESHNSYKILGIPDSALPKDAKKAYHRLAKQYHPDIPGGTAQSFYQISSAYDEIKSKQAHSNFCSQCGALYSDSLVLTGDLGKFAPFICSSGIHKTILPEEQHKRFMQMPKDYKVPRLQVKKISDVVGNGVITVDKILARSFIKQYTGSVELMHHSLNDCKKYVLTVCYGEYQLVIDAESVGNETGRMNHSYDANCCLQPVVDAQTGLVQFWLIALRDIAPGEELVWNYGTYYWRSQNIVPVEKHVKHIFQDSKATVYALVKDGTSTIVVNDNPIAQCLLFASGFIMIKNETFIVIIQQEKDQLLPIILQKDDVSVNLVQDVAALEASTQKQLVDYFVKLANQPKG